MNNNKLMADLLFPNVTLTIAELESKFPRRKEFQLPAMLLSNAPLAIGAISYFSYQ